MLAPVSAAHIVPFQPSTVWTKSYQEKGIQSCFPQFAYTSSEERSYIPPVEGIWNLTSSDGPKFNLQIKKQQQQKLKRHVFASFL